MKENEEGLVYIEDVTEHVMKELLRFIYTGKVRHVGGFVKELFVAADKYLVIGLEDVCERYLIRNITDENVIEYLNLACTYNASSLKEKCMHIFKMNVDELVSKPDFKLSMLDKNILDEVFHIVVSALKN
ncbi:hypothetical protein QAD02_011021 [Eretmocerus hayati]|uniref:Uncharacterized protein n=1 Tax=Eretmocerus hayati TaxID=131215 RepID=A0ACC2NVE7_9HYME|nr:hypothetical protein QAD02_011021 [Eretmocerus hayati]